MGYRRVTWEQLRNSDRALWTYVALKCENGCAAKPAEHQTQFELHFKAGMSAPTVTTPLQFLPQGSGPSVRASSSPLASTATPPPAQPAMGKLQNRIANLEAQLKASKRRLENQGAERSVNQKGKGKGRDRKYRGRDVPAHMKDYPTRHEDQPICFNWNSASKCPHAGPGGRCNRGLHICPKCSLAGKPLADCAHSLAECPAVR